MKEILRDPHEYKLRTMKEIKDDLKETNGKFNAEVDIICKDYNDAKFHESAMNRKVIIKYFLSICLTLARMYRSK